MHKVRVDQGKIKYEFIRYELTKVRVYLSIFLYVLIPEGDIRRVPRNQVLWGFFLFVSFCAMLVVSERRASACLILLNAKQGSH